MNRLDHIGLGIGIGLITSFIGFLLAFAYAHFMQARAINLTDLWNYSAAAVPFIQLGSLLNFIPFYIFLNKDRYKTARGIVIMAIGLFLFSFVLSFG